MERIRSERRRAHREISPEGSRTTPTARAAAGDPRSVLEICWFDQEAMAQLLVDQQADSPCAASTAAPSPAEDSATPAQTPSPPEPIRPLLSRLLRTGETTTIGALEAEALGHCDDAGALVAPSVVVQGELSLPFDPLAELEATAESVAPFAHGDRALQELIALVNQLLATPLHGSPELARSFTGKLHDAWQRSAKRSLPAAYLEQNTRRLLLEQRKYQKKQLLGEELIRAELTGDDGVTVPAYLPAALSRTLPLFPTFRVRLVAEALPRQDAHESAGVALRVVALARELVPR